MNEAPKAKAKAKAKAAGSPRLAGDSEAKPAQESTLLDEGYFEGVGAAGAATSAWRVVLKPQNGRADIAVCLNKKGSHKWLQKCQVVVGAHVESEHAMGILKIIAAEASTGSLGEDGVKARKAQLVSLCISGSLLPYLQKDAKTDYGVATDPAFIQYLEQCATKPPEGDVAQLCSLEGTASAQRVTAGLQNAWACLAQRVTTGLQNTWVCLA